MDNKRACIVDYGVGNIRSVSRVIESTELISGANISVSVTRDHAQILDSDLIVLPGVGSFGAACEQLSSWSEDLVDVIRSGKPTVGICLGMQLLFEESEEGPGRGLGIFEGNVTKLTSKRVPHMGWNEIISSELNSEDELWAYFAHSFACRPKRSEIVAGWTTFEDDKFPSIVRENNVLGTQFHPEKSDLAGVELLHDFIREVLK